MFKKFDFVILGFIIFVAQFLTAYILTKCDYIWGWSYSLKTYNLQIDKKKTNYLAEEHLTKIFGGRFDVLVRRAKIKCGIFKGDDRILRCEPIHE